MTRHSLVLGRFYEKGSAYLYQLGALECLVIVVLVLITRVLAFPPSRRGHQFVGVAEDGSWSAGTRVSFESQFIVDNKEYKHGITNNVIFFSRSAPLCSSLFCPVSYTSLPHDSFDQL